MLRTHPRPTGYPGRQLRTLAPHRGGGVNLRVPKLRRQTFETAIIERYRRQESSVEEALIEMHLAGISVRRVEDITRRSGAPVSAEHGVVRRDNQDENPATIRMRMRRCWGDEGRA